MTIMYEEDADHDYSSLIDPADTDPALSNFNLSTEMMGRYFENQRVLQSKIRERARSILSPAQIEIFEKNQDSHLDMLRDSMEISSSLLEDSGSND